MERSTHLFSFFHTIRHIFSHIGVTLLAVGIAFSLPVLAKFILFTWWPLVEGDSQLLLINEVIFAAVLVLLFNLFLSARQGRLSRRMMRLVSLVHVREEGNWLSRWTDRNLLDRKLVNRISGTRDVSVMSVTGYDTFVSQKRNLGRVIDHSYELRVMLMNPYGAARNLLPGDGGDGRAAGRPGGVGQAGHAEVLRRPAVLEPDRHRGIRVGAVLPRRRGAEDAARIRLRAGQGEAQARPVLRVLRALPQPLERSAPPGIRLLDPRADLPQRQGQRSEASALPAAGGARRSAFARRAGALRFGETGRLGLPRFSPTAAYLRLLDENSSTLPPRKLTLTERFPSPHTQLRTPITSSHESGEPISRVTSS